jgi:hypothetical protein
MNNRFSRQEFLGKNSEKFLTNLTVGLIGLCGGGSHIAQQTAHIGIGNFVCSDYDHIDISNTNRLVCSTPQDAAMKLPKTDITRRTITSANPNANVILINDKWHTNELLFRTCDIIFGCVDSFVARDEIERFCRRYLIPYIDIGMDVHENTNGFYISGQSILSLPGGHCMRCLGFLNDSRLAEEERKYGAAGGRPQVIWPNGVLASTAVGQMIQLFLPWHSDMKPSVMVEYDGNRQTTRESTKLNYLNKKPCEHYSRSESLGDLFYATE